MNSATFQTRDNFVHHRPIAGIPFAMLLAVGATSALRAAPSSIDAAPTQQIAAKELPAPDRADLVPEDRPYFVGPFDTLEIDVFGIEDMKARAVQVDTSGRISFPLVGTVKVAGLTPNEIQTLIQRRLAENYVRNPQVTVNLKEIVSQVVTVEGEVKKPGQFPVAGRMTLLRAIAKAEGTDEFSKLNDVVIFRTVKGQSLAALYNLKAIRKGAYPDPEIYANDVVVVGESSARRIFKDFLGIAPALVTPLVVLLQR